MLVALILVPILGTMVDVREGDVPDLNILVAPFVEELRAANLRYDVLGQDWVALGCLNFDLAVRHIRDRVCVLCGGGVVNQCAPGEEDVWSAGGESIMVRFGLGKARKSVLGKNPLLPQASSSTEIQRPHWTMHLFVDITTINSTTGTLVLSGPPDVVYSLSLVLRYQRILGYTTPGCSPVDRH